MYTSESGVMTPGYMTLTLGPRKNPWRKVAFLLEKTVKACSLSFQHFLGEFGSGCPRSLQIHQHEFGLSRLEGRAVNPLLTPNSLGSTVIKIDMLV